MTIRSIIKTLKNTNILWRYGYNFSPTLTYSTEADNNLNLIEKNIVKNLNNNGIAFSTVDNLLGKNKLFQELDSNINSILKARKEEIAQLKLRAKFQ